MQVLIHDLVVKVLDLVIAILVVNDVVFLDADEVVVSDVALVLRWSID